MNGNLLELVNFDSTVKQTRRGAGAPLMMEFQVNPELAPFLVSSTRSVQWVQGASQTGTIRAAVRDRSGLEGDLVTAVVQLGLEAQWGNVQDLTTEGILKCVEHVSSYDLAPLEALVSPDTNIADLAFPEGVAVTAAPWVPLEAVVVVPVDRGFVGTLGTIGKRRAIAVVHNAARAVAVAARVGPDVFEETSR